MQDTSDPLHSSKKDKSDLQVNDESFDSIPINFQETQKHKRKFENPMELCKFLEISFVQLENIINSPKYKHHVIKKKRGGKRSLFEPKGQLKRIQRVLNHSLQSYYSCIKPIEVHGFVREAKNTNESQCNIVENAKVHVNKKHILNIDLKDFFPSISAHRIKKLFTSPVFNFDEQMAIALTLLTTYKGKLPTGAPTSPVLSNLACLRLDADLRLFCQKNQLQYTRYADDLTFSSNEIISEESILKIKKIIRRNGFEVNKKKLYLRSSNRKQAVTGLTVNKKVNVDRKRLKKIRAMLHDLIENGVKVAAQRHFKQKNLPDGKLQQLFVSSINLPDERLQQLFINRLSGYINFVGQVRGKNDALYLKMINQLKNPGSPKGHTRILENHLYREIFCGGQTHYIVLKGTYSVLYNTDFERIIDEKFRAEQIIPFKDINRRNELVIIKGNQRGIFYIDQNIIRWGYKGYIDENTIY